MIEVFFKLTLYTRNEDTRISQIFLKKYFEFMKQNFDIIIFVFYILCFILNIYAVSEEWNYKTGINMVTNSGYIKSDLHTIETINNN